MNDRESSVFKRFVSKRKSTGSTIKRTLREVSLQERAGKQINSLINKFTFNFVVINNDLEKHETCKHIQSVLKSLSRCNSFMRI